MGVINTCPIYLDLFSTSTEYRGMACLVTHSIPPPPPPTLPAWNNHRESMEGHNFVYQSIASLGPSIITVMSVASDTLTMHDETS